jgi:hypothetical protein
MFNWAMIARRMKSLLFGNWSSTRANSCSTLKATSTVFPPRRRDVFSLGCPVTGSVAVISWDDCD